MKLKKLLAVLLVLAMSVMMFAGCGKKDDTDNGANNNTGTEDTNKDNNTDDEEDTNVDEELQNSDRSAYPGSMEEGAIAVNISSEPPDLFSVTMTDTISFSVLRHVVESLVMLDANDEVIPGVATDWTMSEDGLTYTFNLREGMNWTNGEPVTAHDFVFAWTALLSPDFASDYAAFGYVFKNGVAYNNGEVGAEELGFKAISDYELEVTLENPTPYFLSTLAFGVFAPVNEKAYNEFGEAYGTDADKLVTNGPFTMTSWEHESEIVLEKNPDFYAADDIEIEKINMVMINDTNAAMNAFKAGEVDMIGINGEQADMMRAENYPIITYDDGSSWYLEFSLLEDALQNDNLRKAIVNAIDKESFVTNIIKNNSKAAATFTPPAINGLNDKFANEVGELVPAFDPDAAKDYYATALEELGVDKVEIVMISDDSDTAVKHSAFIQEQLKVNLGLEIVVENMPFKSRLDRMSQKDFSIVFAGWGPDYNDPMTFLDMFETGNGNNHTSYSSDAYDELLDNIRKELDPETRFGYLMDTEKLLMEDLPVAPIYWRSRDYIVSGKIASGVVRTAFQDMNFRNVKLAQ